MLLMLCGAKQSVAQQDTLARPATRENLVASLVTCYPGPEIFELCGHEALRIRGVDADGMPVDSVWNYGIFDFDSPGFVYRFVKGETDYMVMGYPFEWFLPSYERRGSKVVEQDLNLTPEQISRLRKMLQENSLPQNRTYRYNYVLDNCSTRIVEMVDSAAGERVAYPLDVTYPTFRAAMRHYHHNYPWYQFGIDLVLGSGIDFPITSRAEMFVPMRFEENAAKATFGSDGRAFVLQSRLLYEGREDAVKPPTSFWLSPLAVGLYVLAITIAVSLYDYKRRKMSRWWYAIFFGVLGLAGILIWFLVFISTHYATSPNILAIWLSPLQLVIPICIWIRKAMPAATAMFAINLLLIVLLALIWPFQSQSGNVALIPYALSALILSVTPLLPHK